MKRSHIVDVVEMRTMICFRNQSKQLYDKEGTRETYESSKYL